MAKLSAVVTFILLAIAQNAMAQRAPLCDVDCGPDGGSPTYLANVGSRVTLNNARGSARPNVSRFTTVASTLPGIVQQLPGSQSFDWSMPIVHLPGRAGLDLNLILSYNSRVWDVNTDNNSITFNSDRDFPSYGFRLDFGYLEKDSTDGIWILTDADGSKHSMAQTSTSVWDSTDSTYIELNSSTMILSYRDGEQVSYQIFPSLSPGSDPLYRPIQITNTNGNYISINYVSGRNQAISSITDTLGRIVNFNYDVNAQLSSITQGTVPNIFTFATFQWNNINLNYNFTGLTVADSLASGTSIAVLAKCVLANGTYYTFNYGDWGVITKISNYSNTNALRSYESFNYPTAATALSDVPTYTEQIVSPDGTTQYPWLFTTTKSGDIVSAQSTTDPSNTVTTVNLASSGPCAGMPSSIGVQNGSTMLRTTFNTWTADSLGNNCQIANSVYVLNDSGQQYSSTYNYDSHGNLTDQNDKDFNGATLRETVIGYQAPTANHILNLVNTIQVRDGSGIMRKRIDFSYDIGSPAPISGALQNAGTSSARGNLTNVTQYLNAQAATGPINRTFSYDSLGNIILAQLNSCVHKSWLFSSTTQYAYPDSVTLQSDCGTLSLTTSSTYDVTSGSILTATDPNNQSTHFHFDSSRRPDQVTLPNGTVLSTGFDDSSASPALTFTNNFNNLTTFRISDGLGRVIEEQTNNAAARVSTIGTVYDGLGHPTSITNPYAPGDSVLLTHATYDALGRVHLVSPPSGGSYQYDYNGNATTSTDPAGKQIRRFSDPIGRLIEVDEPALGSLPGSGTIVINGTEKSDTISTRYCAQFNLQGRCVDFETDETTIYDTGRITITVNGVSKSFTYGEFDDVNSIASNLAHAFNIDPASPVSATSSLNSLSLRSVSTGLITNYSVSNSVTYDTSTFTAPSFTISSPTALSGGTDPAVTILTPAITTYTYRPTNELLGSLSGSQARSYSFDDLGRVTSSALPENGTTSFSYFDFGGVQSKTDARGVITNYSYDGLNRLAQISYNVGSTGIVNPGAVAFSYGTNPAAFENGRMTSMTDASGSETYAYQQMGWVNHVNKTINGANYPLGYSYDSLGDLTQIVYPSGRVVGQTYDAIGRDQSITSNGANAIVFNSYNAADQVTGVSYGNNVTGAFGYNDHLQVQSIIYSNGTSTLLNLSYGYGAQNNGLIQSITDARGAAFSTSYTYDALNRLSAAQTNDLSSANTWALSWSYDRFGNRLSQSITGGTMAVGQPLLTADPATNHISTSGFTYDSNGNLTNDNQHGYTFDAANRIGKVDGGSTAVYTYDGNGYRVAKGTTTYVRSGTQVIAEYLGGTLQTEYLYSNGTLLASISGGAITYHHSDHLSDRIETDSSGNGQRAYGHLPFGETWYETGVADKWKFTVYERDPETGLDCAVARYDSTGLGRFMSVDPLSGEISSPQSLNRYTYTLNNPVNFSDPLGMATCTLNIKVNNKANLSDSDVKAIEARINQIFGATSTPDGNTLSASFSNTSGDFSLNLSPGTGVGIEFHVGGWGIIVPTVHIGSAQNTYGADWILGAGTIAAHELSHRIGKAIWSAPDTAYNGTPNLMNADAALKQGVNTASGDTASPPSGFSQLTPDQVAKLYKTCLKKQKKQKGGGGGGGGGTGPQRPGPSDPGFAGDGGGGDDCPSGDCHPPCYPNCSGEPVLKIRSSLYRNQIKDERNRRVTDEEALFKNFPVLDSDFFILRHTSGKSVFIESADS